MTGYNIDYGRSETMTVVFRNEYDKNVQVAGYYDDVEKVYRKESNGSIIENVQHTLDLN